MKEIQLSQGKAAFVDDADYEWLSQWKWYARQVKNSGLWYAQRGNRREDGTRQMMLMHREIMGHPEGIRIDHHDGDGLNNQRSNLRKATNSQNMLNAGLYVTNTSGFKGVYWEPRKRRWSARIEVEGKKMRFGTYPTKEEAAQVYAFHAARLAGEFARTTPFEGRHAHN